MKIGKILIHIKLFHGVNNMIQEMQEIDGFVEKCKNRIRNKDKLRKRII